MMDPSKTVFISHRHDGAWALARLIYTNLEKNNYHPLIDVESIGSGPFDTQILQLIEQSCHFLLVITPNALQRCVNPDDWLRKEIEYAFQLNRNIIPMRVDGFEFKDNTKYLGYSREIIDHL
jgi:TIR domain